MPDEGRVLYCHCAYSQVVPAEVKREVLLALAESNTAFEAVPDLCELSARRDPALKRLARHGGLRIVACFPRAVRWLFHAAGADLPDSGVEVLNMRRASADEIVRAVRDASPSGGTKQ